MDESGDKPHDGVLGVQFEPDASLAAEMATMAGRYVERGRRLKVALDFTDASIEAADGIGLRMYEALPRDGDGVNLEELRSTLATELGAYFGETFIRNHGGQWGWVAGTGNRVFGLRTDAGLSAFPLGKARKRLQRAENENLSGLYNFLARWTATQTKRRSIGSRFWGRTPPQEPAEAPAEELAGEPAREPSGEARTDRAGAHGE